MLRKCANSVDIAAVTHISNKSRRCEVLAWRAIVRRELGNDVHIGYDEYGAPQVDIHDRYISVSHSRGVVAVLISDTPCAVDIEHKDRDFRRVASRYLSDREREIAEQNNLFAEMWSAKEALYKYHKRGSLDLVKHIRIDEYNPSKNMFVATILDGEPIEVAISNNGNLTIALIR
jgi:phosphopantetheinyl transferase